MRFSRLRLNGFKSFVDPTDLVIHQGLTGVVGPNGCGKSNLLEALRWVMGENRPTAMRGGEMEDVIFAGTATRPARNFAEVTLVLDNAERLAPSGFNETDHIEIVRRITRDAGSAYKANLRDVRARDIQMLFADASTGSHSPALVRQGQIAELINAKPKSRRLLLEEAAGISGLYQRRHEAELRLTATETNLSRLDDVLEALATQLATLARQARQAQRYREIGEDLRRTEGMLLFRRWREADVARLDADANLRDRVLATAQAEHAARSASAVRTNADDALPSLREEEAIAAAILQRLSVQRDTLADQEARAQTLIATLRARSEQLGHDIDREVGLNHDAVQTISQLEWELAQLAQGHDGHDDRLTDAQSATREAEATLRDHEAKQSQITEDVARLAARHQSAQRLLDDTRTTLQRSISDAANAAGAFGAAEAALALATEAYEIAQEATETAAAAAEAADDALASTEAARADVQSREAEARAAKSSAEGEASALRAEVAALSRLVDREALAGSQIMDLLQVTPGYEAALGAALADDLRAPEVTRDRRSGWALLADYLSPQALPSGASALSDWVKAPAVLTRRLGQTGLVSRTDGQRLQADLLPGQRLVSIEGDLWRWDGLRSTAEDAPSAAALRLQQLNRLVQLKHDLGQVSTRADDARLAHEALHQKLGELARADQFARDARRAADAQVTETSRTAARAEADASIAAGKLDAARLAISRFADETTAARDHLAKAEAAALDLPDLSAARVAGEALRLAVDTARTAMLTRRSTMDELRREGEARIKRKQDATTELSGWRHRLETAEKRSAELALRKARTENELADALAAPEDIAALRENLNDAMQQAQTRCSLAADALALAETAAREAHLAERDAERGASESRESRARAEARAEAAVQTVALAQARIADEVQSTPADLLERLAVDPQTMPDADALETDVGRLKRQREALGAVNLRAEEDALSIQQDHDKLLQEKTDLDEAVKKLRAGIAALNREGRERLLTAFEQVNTNFAALFTHLFGGGEARLVLVESDDPLEAGLELMCQPPGKKLATLSLLSGGEQTLTALALIFGVFLANPAPICVLDEVDAPLDDANVTRFCDLLDEMSRRTETRFMVITHHAVTMARMDRLFGVTMAEQGVSQLVSVDLKRAEALVA